MAAAWPVWPGSAGRRSPFGRAALPGRGGRRPARPPARCSPLSATAAGPPDAARRAAPGLRRPRDLKHARRSRPAPRPRWPRASRTRYRHRPDLPDPRLTPAALAAAGRPGPRQTPRRPRGQARRLSPARNDRRLPRQDEDLRPAGPRAAAPGGCMRGLRHCDGWPPSSRPDQPRQRQARDAQARPPPPRPAPLDLLPHRHGTRGPAIAAVTSATTTPGRITTGRQASPRGLPSHPTERAAGRRDTR